MDWHIEQFYLKVTHHHTHQNQGSQWPLLFSDWWGHGPSTFFDRPVLTYKTPQKTCCKMFNMMKTSAPNHFTSDRFSKKLQLLRGAHPPSDTPLPRASATVTPVLIGTDTLFLTFKIYPPHFENCSDAHAHHLSYMLVECI